jgi:hypothetical protein
VVTIGVIRTVTLEPLIGDERVRIANVNGYNGPIGDNEDLLATLLIH